MNEEKKHVTVCGEMKVLWTVELPIDTAREPVACDDPAIEAAMQAISQHINTYLWGEDKPPAVVYCEVDEEDVEIESDDRE